MAGDTEAAEYDRLVMIQTGNTSNIEELAGMAPGRRSALVRYLFAVGMAVALVSVSVAAEPTEIRIGYLRVPENKAAISLLDMPPDNDGIAGARLAIEDNNTTG